MGLFDLLRKTQMDRGVASFQTARGAALLDVRTPAEYRKGHVPGSRNIPLDEIESVPTVFPDMDTPLCLYCHSGARSGRAAAYLRRRGYTSVQNIGGIADYHGKVE